VPSSDYVGRARFPLPGSGELGLAGGLFGVEELGVGGIVLGGLVFGQRAGRRTAWRGRGMTKRTISYHASTRRLLELLKSYYYF
jgi:hypothetical protein